MPNSRSVFSLSAHVYALVWGLFLALLFAFSMLVLGVGTKYSINDILDYYALSPWLLMIIGGVIGLVGYKKQNMQLHQIAAGCYVLDLILIFVFVHGPTPFDGFLLYPTIALSLIGLFKKQTVQSNPVNS